MAQDLRAGYDDFGYSAQDPAWASHHPANLAVQNAGERGRRGAGQLQGSGTVTFWQCRNGPVSKRGEDER